MNRQMVPSLPKCNGLRGTNEVPANVTVSAGKKGSVRLLSMNSHAWVRVRGLMSGLQSSLCHV